MPWSRGFTWRHWTYSGWGGLGGRCALPVLLLCILKASTECRAEPSLSWLTPRPGPRRLAITTASHMAGSRSQEVN